MTSPPAGPCEWCGGSQWWTVARGVMYVKCMSGCLSLFPEELFDFPPPDGVVDGHQLDEWGPELSVEEGVEPPEGADVNDDTLPF